MTLNYVEKLGNATISSGSIGPGEDESSSINYQDLRSRFPSLGQMTSYRSMAIIHFHTNQRGGSVQMNAELINNGIAITEKKHYINVSRGDQKNINERSVRFTFTPDRP